MKLKTTILALSLATASTPLAAQAWADWNRVERLAPGSIVIVADESGAAVRGRLLRADADSILLYAPTADPGSLQLIEKMAREQPKLLSRVDRVGMDLPDARLHIAADGISKDGVRVASFGQVFHAGPRSAVVSVSKPKDQRHAYGATIAGVVIGGVAGLFGGAAILLSDEQCQPNCRSPLFGYAVTLGSPVLGGMIGDRLGRPREDLLIYHR